MFSAKRRNSYGPPQAGAPPRDGTERSDRRVVAGSAARFCISWHDDNDQVSPEFFLVVTKVSRLAAAVSRK